MKKTTNRKFCRLFFINDNLLGRLKIKILLPFLFVISIWSTSAIDSYAGEKVENGKPFVKKLSSLTTMEQQITISGTVKDAITKEPLPGVNVLVEGTSLGTITGVDGKYSINVPQQDAVLIFSFIGHVKERVTLSEGMTELDIALMSDIETLDEIVVIGYGTMRKKDLTGSITQIRPEKLENENPNSVQDILRGTPGLRVGFDGSAKGGGSMQIRGQRSVYTAGGHNDPLIVLDGMIFYGELSEINPDDIGQIDVLKDASAAAVYGARAANGVIIITTKKGKRGKPMININSNIGFTTMGIDRKVYDPEGYRQFYEDWYTTPTQGINPETGNWEDYQTTFMDRPGYYSFPTEENLAKYGITLQQWRDYSNDPAEASEKEIYAGRMGIRDKSLQNFLDDKSFDWYDHTFRTGFNQDYNISVSGATEGVNYYMSMGYLSNEGVVIGNDYSTIRSNLKLEGKVNKRMTVGANVNFQNRTDGDLAANWPAQILQNSPYAAYTDADGDLDPHPMRDGGYARGYNYDFNRQYQELEKGYTILNSILTAKLELPFNITYSFNVSPRYQLFYDRYHESSEHPDWAGINGLVNREQSRRFDWSLNNTINWNQTFADKHRIDLTLVQEAEERQYWQDRIEARNITPTDALGFHATGNANKDLSNFDSEDTRETADAMLARLFYSFENRYMITSSIRRDGYSAFGTSNPRATFYSMAVAWTFTNESFFNWEHMSNGKLRLSWGQNGNRSLNNPYIALANLGTPQNGITAQGYYSNGGSYDLFQVLEVQRLANTHLQWEKTTAYNVGLDLGFLTNRISTTFEYYVMPTTDMIMEQSLPSFSGFTEITTNLGEVENRGVELFVSSQNVSQNNFQWNTTFGFSRNKNTIKHLYYRYHDVLDENGNVIGTEEDNDIDNEWFIGQPISAIWYYNVTGIWQMDEAEEAERYGQRPGEPKVANNYTADDRENEDGTTTPVYNDEDKEFLGQKVPPIHWSLRNDFTLYKYFNLSFNIYSYMGHKILSGNYLNRENNLSQIDNNFNIYEREYWTIDNPINEYACLNASGPTGLNAPQKLYDRSFIRLENIALSYTVPTKYISRLGMEKVKIYGNIRNVWLWAKEWEYWDAETFNPDAGDPQRTGISPRVYTIGLNIIL